MQLPSLIVNRVRIAESGRLDENELTPRSKELRRHFFEGLRAHIILWHYPHDVRGSHHSAALRAHSAVSRREEEDPTVFVAMSVTELMESYKYMKDEDFSFMDKGRDQNTSHDIKFQFSCFHDVLCTLLLDTDCWHRLAAIEGLCLPDVFDFTLTFGGGPIDLGCVVSSCLHDRFPLVRRFAIKGLCLLGEAARQHSQLLAYIALEDEERRIRAEAARSLVYLGEPALGELVMLLEESDFWVVRCHAAEALGALRMWTTPLGHGSSSSRDAVVDALCSALSDRFAGVRQSACVALRGMGFHALYSIEKVLLCLRDSEICVRTAAVKALGSIICAAAPKYSRLCFDELMRKGDISIIDPDTSFPDALRLVCRGITGVLRDHTPLFKVAAQARTVNESVPKLMQNHTRQEEKIHTGAFIIVPETVLEGELKLWAGQHGVVQEIHEEGGADVNWFDQGVAYLPASAFDKVKKDDLSTNKFQGFLDKENAAIDLRRSEIWELFHAAEIALSEIGVYALPNMIRRLIEEDEQDSGFINRMSLMRGLVFTGCMSVEAQAAMVSEWIGSPQLEKDRWANNLTSTANTMPLKMLMQGLKRHRYGFRWVVLRCPDHSGDVCVAFGRFGAEAAAHLQSSSLNTRPLVVDRVPVASVHGGLWDELDEIWSEVISKVQTACVESGGLRRLRICGAGIGGALALTMATRLYSERKHSGLTLPEHIPGDDSSGVVVMTFGAPNICSKTDGSIPYFCHHTSRSFTLPGDPLAFMMSEHALKVHDHFGKEMPEGMRLLCCTRRKSSSSVAKPMAAVSRSFSGLVGIHSVPTDFNASMMRVFREEFHHARLQFKPILRTEELKLPPLDPANDNPEAFDVRLMSAKRYTNAVCWMLVQRSMSCSDMGGTLSSLQLKPSNAVISVSVAGTLADDVSDASVPSGNAGRPDAYNGEMTL